MTPVSDRIYDAIVVGMGPAGASVAYALSAAGFSVLGLEKARHPRYKVCGGGLSARIAPFLPADFHEVVEETIHRVQFAYGGDESFVIESAHPIAYMVMRARFDHWLVQQARQVGAIIRESEPVESVAMTSTGVEVVSARGRYRGRFLVGADGAMGVVAQQIFPKRRDRAIPALECELALDGTTPYQATRTALISLSAAKKGYGWIFPKRHGLSVGIGEFVNGTRRPKQSFQEFSRREPVLAALAVPTPVGHPLPICRPGSRFDGRQGALVNRRTLLVGDAGHLVDPLLGEGIYYAVRSGQLAAAAIGAALRDPSRGLESYEAAVIREFGTEFHIASRLGCLVYGLPRSWHRWAGRLFPESYQRALRRYCQMLQGEETYRTLWSRILQRLKGPFSLKGQGIESSPKN